MGKRHDRHIAWAKRRSGARTHNLDFSNAAGASGLQI